MPKTTRPRRVDFTRPDDFGAAYYASMGFGYRFISKKTGLRNGQIGYRLRKSDTRCTDWRQGLGFTVRSFLASEEAKIIEIDVRRRITEYSESSTGQRK